MTGSTDAAPSANVVAIRHAVPADYPEIARITVAAYLASGHFDPESPYLRHIADVADRHQDAEIWVAELAGSIVGAVTLVRSGSRYADIALQGELEFRMLAVDPGVQRSGAGRAMVRAIVDHARRLDGVYAVSLTTGEMWGVPRRLYASEGFVHAPERDWLVPGTDIRLVVYVLDLGGPDAAAVPPGD